jgi:hypothetical protein
METDQAQILLVHDSTNIIIRINYKVVIHLVLNDPIPIQDMGKARCTTPFQTASCSLKSPGYFSSADNVFYGGSIENIQWPMPPVRNRFQWA